MISTFISGVRNDYLQEQLLRDTHKSLFDVYEAACVIENSLKKKGAQDRARARSSQGGSSNRVKCFKCQGLGHKSPPVAFAGNGEGRAIGQAEVLVKFTRMIVVP